MPRGPYRRREAAEAVEQAQEPTPVLTQPVASPRAAEARRERRRREDGDLDRMASLKLAVPQDIQEQTRREGKVVRWILDTRMAEAHGDDWDTVPGVEPVQANPMMGSPERLVLCSKYADWHAADVRRDDRIVDETEKQIVAGNVNDDGKSSAGLVVPRGQANRITTQQGL